MKDKPLFHNIYFNISLWGGIILSVITSIFIVANSELHWCFKAACFTKFLDIFNFPIKLMSASIFLSGFIALIHRSEQTRYQIEISTNQFLFKNFIDHKKEFIDLLLLMESDFKVRIKDKSILYKSLFPNNNAQRVEFISTGEHGEKSKLYFLIEQYNQLICRYDEIMKNRVLKEVDIKALARWLGEFMVLSRELGIQSADLKRISSSWNNIINSYDGLPADINQFMLSFKKILIELSSFCLLDESKIVLKDIINYPVQEVVNSFYERL